MGISRESSKKRSLSGAKRHPIRKSRKFEMGRPPAMTRLGAKRIHQVRVRGGATKARALRLDSGNFSWGSEVVTRKVRILDVNYNASNLELLRTKTLVKNAIVQVDATPFKQWYEAHYGVKLATRGGAKVKDADEAKKKESGHVQAIKKLRQKTRKLDPAIEEQFQGGRLFAAISSRPGQSGRADGYILEGEELVFYKRMMQKKKAGAAK
jgi:small subunit ribosomal protein S8e